MTNMSRNAADSASRHLGAGLIACVLFLGVVLAAALRSGSGESRSKTRTLSRANPPNDDPRIERLQEEYAKARTDRDRLQAEVIALRSQVACQPNPRVDDRRLEAEVQRARGQLRRAEWEEGITRALRLFLPTVVEELFLTSDQEDRVYQILLTPALRVAEKMLALESAPVTQEVIRQAMDPSYQWDEQTDTQLTGVLTPTQMDRWHTLKQRLQDE